MSLLVELQIRISIKPYNLGLTFFISLLTPTLFYVFKMDKLRIHCNTSYPYLATFLRCWEEFFRVIEKKSFARSASQYYCALGRTSFNRCAVMVGHSILFALFYVRTPCGRQTATTTLLYHHLIW